MAAKKNEKKKEPLKEEIKQKVYDYEQDLESMEIPQHIKKGFKYFLRFNKNNEVKDKKDFDKKYDEFMNQNAGA